MSLSLDEQRHHSLLALHDLAALTGVLTELQIHDKTQQPEEIEQVIRFFNLMKSETFLYGELQQRAAEEEGLTPSQFNHFLTILQKYNWVLLEFDYIKVRDIGRRMMTEVIRLVNESARYYEHGELERLLFQAQREVKKMSLFEDEFISSGSIYHDIFTYVDQVKRQVKRRELEFLASKYGLAQLTELHEQLQQLQRALTERHLPSNAPSERALHAVEETAVFCLSLIEKYKKFTDLAQTTPTIGINRQKWERFLYQMYQPPKNSDVANAHQILSFMEHGSYDGEQIDGIWLPIKYASPLHEEAIRLGIEYIDNYEPRTASAKLTYEWERADETLSDEEIDELLQTIQWEAVQQPAAPVAMNEREQSLEEWLSDQSADQWEEAIASLNLLSQHIHHEQVEWTTETKRTKRNNAKRWEWNEHDMGTTVIRRR